MLEMRPETHVKSQFCFDLTKRGAVGNCVFDAAHAKFIYQGQLVISGMWVVGYIRLG
jgi:hypothetical protein